MKLLNKIFIFVLFITSLVSCDKNENFEILETQSDFSILTPTNGSEFVLNRTNPDNNLLSLTWKTLKNANSPYTIEVAKTGTDFEAPVVLGTSDDKNFNMTVETFNSFLVNSLRIPQAIASSIEFRIVDADGNKSDISTLVVTPYVIKVLELFVNGTFTNWDPTQSLPMTLTDFNIFTINLDLVDGDEFNFIPNNISDDIIWQLEDSNSLNVTKFGGVNISGLSAGNYDITVDLNNNTILIEEITFPEELYIVGAGVPDAGWGWGSPVIMNLTSEDVFEVQTSLINDTFRFFTSNGDWGSGLNFPYFIADGYTIDSNFEDAMDGDNNFRFLGTPGLYNIKVDGVNKTITATQMVQSIRIAVPGNHQGWDPTTAPQLEASAIGATDYEGYVWLDGGHKFVGPDANGNFAWGNIDWGDDGSFTGLLLADGESNCEASIAGYYFITANTSTLTYTETNYNWGLIGSATGSWSTDQDMVYDATSGTWSITLDLVVGELKFRANDDWGWNYGDTNADGSLENNGDNIAISSDGNYTIILDLSTPRSYTYSVTQN